MVPWLEPVAFRAGRAPGRSCQRPCHRRGNLRSRTHVGNPSNRGPRVGTRATARQIPRAAALRALLGSCATVREPARTIDPHGLQAARPEARPAGRLDSAENGGDPVHSNPIRPTARTGPSILPGADRRSRLPTAPYCGRGEARLTIVEGLP